MIFSYLEIMSLFLKNPTPTIQRLKVMITCADAGQCWWYSCLSVVCVTRVRKVGKHKGVPMDFCLVAV